MSYEIRYFTNNNQQVDYIRPLKNAEFEYMFPGINGLRYDSFSRIVGTMKGDDKTLYPLTRKVQYKTSAPSKHECNAKCLGGKPGGKCECSCGGANHGAGA